MLKSISHEITHQILTNTNFLVHIFKYKEKVFVLFIIDIFICISWCIIIIM